MRTILYALFGYISGSVLYAKNFMKLFNKEELIEVLKGLGYKEKDFKTIINKVSDDKTLEEQVKEALKLLLK